MAARRGVRGRRAGRYSDVPHRLGQHREVARDSGPFWAYLDRFTLRDYARDFIGLEAQRWIIGFICGVLFVAAGVVRMFAHPGWGSLGEMLVGAAIATLFFLGPLLLDLGFAYLGELTWSPRPRGRRRRR